MTGVLLNLQVRRKQSELIRRGVDMAIEEARAEQASWQESWAQACGVWKDRDDIDAHFADYRAEIDARIDDMQQ